MDSEDNKGWADSTEARTDEEARTDLEYFRTAASMYPHISEM